MDSTSLHAYRHQETAALTQRKQSPGGTGGPQNGTRQIARNRSRNPFPDRIAWLRNHRIPWNRRWTRMNADDERTTYLAKIAENAEKAQAERGGPCPRQVAISVYQRSSAVSKRVDRLTQAWRIGDHESFAFSHDHVPVHPARSSPILRRLRHSRGPVPDRHSRRSDRPGRDTRRLRQALHPNPPTST